MGDDYSQPRNGGVKVSIADLPMLSRRSFPLCMANQHAKLGETHHLKNDARNQFGLFLKGIGAALPPDACATGTAPRPTVTVLRHRHCPQTRHAAPRRSPCACYTPTVPTLPDHPSPPVLQCGFPAHHTPSHGAFFPESCAAYTYEEPYACWLAMLIRPVPHVTRPGVRGVVRLLARRVLQEHHRREGMPH